MPDWRLLLKLKGIWQGGIQSPDPQPSASSILPFCRWLLLNHLQREGVLDLYERFVITRSDFFWLCPHPPLSVLDRNAIWVPDGENWGGLNDRHLVVSRAFVVGCLNGLEDILLHPEQLYEEMKHRSGWNDEMFLAHHLERHGLLNKVRRFPYVMYLARWPFDPSPTWSAGRYEPSARHFVKYEHEFRDATSYATIIRSREDWESGAWRQFDPASIVTQPISIVRRVRYFGEHAVIKLVSELRRPGRRARFARFVSRLAGKARAAMHASVQRR